MALFIYYMNVIVHVTNVHHPEYEIHVKNDREREREKKKIVV